MTEQDKSVYLMLGTDDDKKRPSVVCGSYSIALVTNYLSNSMHLRS